jgi:hypothetical protein
MTYTAKYRKVGSFLWTKIKKIEGDSLNEDRKRIAFFLEDGTKIEIPLEGVEIYFSKERFKIIQRQLELESGQRLAVK